MTCFLSDEEILRLGCCAGVASRLLGDDSYAMRFLGKVETVTQEVYLATVAEISARLIAAGHLAADEDLFERMLSR